MLQIQTPITTVRKTFRGSKAAVEQIQNTTDKGLYQSTNLFINAIGKNRQFLNQQAKKIQSKLPQEQRNIIFEGTGVQSLIQSVPQEFNAQFGSNQIRKDFNSQQNRIMMDGSDVRSRLNPQNIQELDKKACEHQQNLQGLRQAYEEYKMHPPQVPRKHTAESWSPATLASRKKSVKFRNQKASLNFQTHGRGLIPPMQLGEETYLSNPNLFITNHGQKEEDYQAQIQKMQQQALLKEQQMMDPHKRSYVKKFKYFLSKKYKSDFQNSIAFDSQISGNTGGQGNSTVFSDRQKNNLSRFSFSSQQPVSPSNVNLQQNVSRASRSRPFSSSQGNINRSRSRQATGGIATYSQSILNQIDQPQQQNMLIAPIYTGNTYTASIPVLSEEILKHIKGIFDSLDTDGYKIIDRKKLVDALNESEKLKDIMDKPAVLKPKISSSNLQQQHCSSVKTVRGLIQQIQNNVNKRPGLITWTEFESYFDFYGSVASQDAELIKAIGVNNSRVIYECFMHVMKRNNNNNEAVAAKRGESTIYQSYQIQQMIECFNSSNPQFFIPQDFPKDDVLSALQAVNNCEKELTWKELANNLQGFLSQGMMMMNHSEYGSQEQIPRQGGRRLGGQDATEESSKVAVAWSVRTLYRPKSSTNNRNKIRDEQLREVSERVHERSQSGLSGGGVPNAKGKYRPMSPTSGAYGGSSRVVTIKEKNQIIDHCHSRGHSSNLINNMGKESKQEMHGDKQASSTPKNWNYFQQPSTSPPKNWQQRNDFKITVPQAYSFMQRDAMNQQSETIMTQKTKAMFQLDQIKQQRQLNAKFRAAQVPQTNRPGLFDKIMTQNEERREQVRQRSVELTRARERPFNFYIRENIKKEALQQEKDGAYHQHCKWDDVMAHGQFKAAPVPGYIKNPQKPVTQIFQEQRTQREQKVREQARISLANAAMPPRMELHAQKLKEENERKATLMNSTRTLNDTVFTFKPQKPKQVPDFKEKQKKFLESLEVKKGKYKGTVQQPFRFNEKRAVNLESKEYMDHQNDWRDKYPLSKKIKELKTQKDNKVNPSSTKKHDALAAKRRKEMEQKKEKQEIDEFIQIERRQKLNRIEPLIQNSLQIQRKTRKQDEYHQIKRMNIQNNIKKMITNQQQYKKELEIMKLKVDERPLLMDQVPRGQVPMEIVSYQRDSNHNEDGVVQEDDQEVEDMEANQIIIQRLIQYLRENGFHQPITNEVLQRVQEDQEIMQQIFGGGEEQVSNNIDQ